MDADLIAKYDLRVPRYTSYPTAPAFGPAVDNKRVAQWLGALDAGETLSLYLHIPFCRSLCWFCGCNTTVVGRDQPISSYADRLAAEIELVADTIGGPRAVTHIHLGGGTPTRLPSDDFRKLTATIRARFTVTDAADIAVEIDPRQLSDDMVGTLAETGVRRVSIGVQDFDPVVQGAVNRIQPFAVVRDALSRLRGRGITAVNLDLMYGLPHQTVDGVLRTVDQAVSLAPDRLALFGYAHVPWMKRHQALIDETKLPDATGRLAQFEAAAARLRARGYMAIGLDHFARPEDTLAIAQRAGRLRRNFQGYTVDAADGLIGFGASAISALPQGYAQNQTAIPDWHKAIAAGRLATARGVEIDDDDRLRRAIIERLMCDLSVDVADQCAAFGRAPADLLSAFDALEPLIDDGLAVRDGWRITVPDEARPALRLVAAAFDAYRAASPVTGSRAL